MKKLKSVKTLIFGIFLFIQSMYQRKIINICFKINIQKTWIKISCLLNLFLSMFSTKILKIIERLKHTIHIYTPSVAKTNYIKISLRCEVDFAIPNIHSADTIKENRRLFRNLEILKTEKNS